MARYDNNGNVVPESVRVSASPLKIFLWSALTLCVIVPLVVLWILSYAFSNAPPPADDEFTMMDDVSLESDITTTTFGIERNVTTTTRSIEQDALQFSQREDLILRTNFRELNNPVRVEVILSLGAGDDGVDLAVDYRYAVLRGGSGVAVRTESFARLLDNTAVVTVPRPDDCVGGCVFSVWITSGWGFASTHREADLVIFARDGGEARIESIEALPTWAYGGS